MERATETGFEVADFGHNNLGRQATCREDILKAMATLGRRHNRDTFKLDGVDLRKLLLDLLESKKSLRVVG